MSQKQELKDRIEAKKKRLQARLAELKADGREQARKEAEALRGSLEDLEARMKEGAEGLTEAVAKKLNDWLKDD